MPIRTARTRDTGKDLAPILNAIEAESGVPAPELLGGAVAAEAGWREHAIRERQWPDVSFGLGQVAVAWAELDGLEPSADRRYRNADTPRNREIVRLYLWDAERALRYVAPRYAALRRRWGDPLAAWCRWNKPNLEPRENPNRAHYERSLAEALAYRVDDEEEEEGPMAFTVRLPARGDFRPGPEGDEEYRKSLLESAVAAMVADDRATAAAALETLGPRYTGLIAHVAARGKA